MPDPRAMIKAELAAHSIKVGDEQVLIHGSNGSKTLPTGQAIALLEKHVAENSSYLLDLWKYVKNEMLPDGRGFSSNDSTRRMFIASVRQLTKQASQNQTLREIGIYRALQDATRMDVTEFSERKMAKIVEYRLAIDWVSHLVAFDTYRKELVETYLSLRAPAEKTASQYGAALPYSRNFVSPGETAIPWDIYRETLLKHRAESAGSNEDKSSQEAMNEYRTTKGMEDQTNGFLDLYDEVKHGVRFRNRAQGTMKDLWDKNQVMRDPTGAQEGARPWGSTDLGATEKGLSTQRR